MRPARDPGAAERLERSIAKAIYLVKFKLLVDASCPEYFKVLVGTVEGLS